MGFEINWTVSPGDPVLKSPLYQKWSVKSFGTIASEAADLKTDLGTVFEIFLLNQNPVANYHQPFITLLHNPDPRFLVPTNPRDAFLRSFRRAFLRTENLRDPAL